MKKSKYNNKKTTRKVNGETVFIENVDGTCILCDEEWGNCDCQDKQPEITFSNIKVERLHDISEEDCLKEGVEAPKECYIPYTCNAYEGYYIGEAEKHTFKAEIWNNLPYKASYDWKSNPYVFVYEFEVLY